MTEREKLLDLIIAAKREDPETGSFTEWLTDYLLANGVTVQKWIPVSERLPKRGEFVLFAYAKDNRNPTMYAKNTMAVGRYDQKMFLVEGCSVKVTHWMPLPQPPKEV